MESNAILNKVKAYKQSHVSALRYKKRAINQFAYNFMYTRGPSMDAISYSTARANLASTMNRVCNDHEPLIITRNGQPSVVMLSLDDFTALEETAYLLRSPANTKRLMAAIEQLSAGKGTERKLAEPTTPA